VTDNAETKDSAEPTKPVDGEPADVLDDVAAADEGSASDESDGGSSQSEAEASPDHQNLEATDDEKGDA